MFRKLFLGALLAAILLGSFIGKGVEQIKVNQVAGGAKAIDPSGRLTYQPYGVIELAGGAKAIDPSGRLTYQPYGVIELAGGAKALDPSGRIQG